MSRHGTLLLVPIPINSPRLLSFEFQLRMGKYSLSRIIDAWSPEFSQALELTPQRIVIVFRQAFDGEKQHSEAGISSESQGSPPES